MVAVPPTLSANIFITQTQRAVLKDAVHLS
jgi:hypothetical protein